jgi:iron(III) transport system substrate-binding protein
VVIYTSVDQVNAEPVLKEFERRSGIRVRPVFDVEASKTTGLANRIAAEKARPQADVFWNNEFVQTLRLKSERLLAASKPRGGESLPAHLHDADGYWFSSGARFRVILANTKRLKPGERPRKLEDFATEKVPARDLAIAMPLFGTSAAQAAALYSILGEKKAREFYTRLRDRGVRVVDGNAVVRDLVAQGSVAAGWTDSDDACGAIERGAAVEMILPDQDAGGALMIPATVAEVAGAPHPKEAQALMEFLLEPATEKMLIDSGFFQMSVREGGPTHACLGGRPVRTMQIALPEIGARLETSRRDMSALFSR